MMSITFYKPRLLYRAIPFGLATLLNYNRERRSKQRSKQKYVSSYYIAQIYAGLGENDQAFAYLNKAFEEHANALLFIKVDPLFDTLRSDPRFTDLLRRIGLAQ